MSVELLDTPRFHGFRVRRQIAGKTWQEYFSLKADGRRLRGSRRAEVLARATARDAELAALQQQAREQAARTVHVAGPGKVRGILFRMKTEKSGTRTPVFQIGIMSPLENRIVNTTVSVARHGLRPAWRKAVAFYCLHKQIPPRTRGWKALIAACPDDALYARMVRDASR